MSNPLTRRAGLQLAPVVLETLVRHYFKRVKKRNEQEKVVNQLMQDELLYHEAFNIIKVRLQDTPVYWMAYFMVVFRNSLK